MATALAANVNVSVAAVLASLLDVGQANYPLNYAPSYNFTDGVGANQAQKIFSDTRTIAISGTDDLDLAGVLVDAFGNVLSFTKVKAIIVQAAAANANDVVIGAAASNQVASIFGAVTHTIKVKPGGVFAIVAPDVNGYSVVAATGDLLRIANSGAGSSVDYTIVIIGL